MNQTKHLLFEKNRYTSTADATVGFDYQNDYHRVNDEQIDAAVVNRVIKGVERGDIAGEIEFLRFLSIDCFKTNKRSCSSSCALLDV